MSSLVKINLVNALLILLIILSLAMIDQRLVPEEDHGIFFWMISIYAILALMLINLLISFYWWVKKQNIYAREYLISVFFIPFISVIMVFLV